MPTDTPLQIEQIRAALAELDQLAVTEYDVPLETLLLSGEPMSALRVQRLVGIVLKRKFAQAPKPVTGGLTGARQSWPWAGPHDALEENKAGAEERALLEQLRMPGSWNGCKPLTGTPSDQTPISWSQFKDNADSERGLFKILALYAVDKFNGTATKSLKEYLEAKETKSFEAGLDLATLLFDAKLIGPLAALLGVPTLAVGVALVGIQFGYRKLADPQVDQVGDNCN